MVGTHLRARSRAPTVGTTVMSDASNQTDLVTKETSVQAAACSKCPDPSPGALVSACTRCRQVEDLIHQVAELQEIVNMLPIIRGSELEIDTWLQNHVTVETTNENEAPWTVVTRKSRTPLQPPASNITTKNKYKALKTVDTQEQGLQEEPTPAAHSGYSKKKRRVLVMGDSVLRGTEVPVCRPGREASEVCCLPGAEVQDASQRVPNL